MEEEVIVIQNQHLGKDSQEVKYCSKKKINLFTDEYINKTYILAQNFLRKKYSDQVTQFEDKKMNTFHTHVFMYS